MLQVVFRGLGELEELDDDASIEVGGWRPPVGIRLCARCGWVFTQPHVFTCRATTTAAPRCLHTPPILTRPLPQLLHLNCSNRVLSHLPYLVALDHGRRAVVLAIRCVGAWVELCSARGAHLSLA